SNKIKSSTTMKLKHTLPVIALALATAGCSSLPEKITPEIAGKHPSINSLIEKTVGWNPTWKVALNDSDRFAGMKTPYRYAEDYCTYEGGKLVVGTATQENPVKWVMNSLPYTLPNQAI